MTKALTKKVLLIGWDAADWKVITPMLDAGQMPNLESLVSQGVMGNLSTLYPPLSPMLWTSIATGKRAYKHGIHGFSEPNPDTGGVRPITILGRKTKAIWNILNQEGKRSNVVGWWPSSPVEPINGVMVSDHYHKAVAGPEKPWPVKPGTIHPKRLINPLADLRLHPSEIEAVQILPFIPKAGEVDQDKDKQLFSVAKTLAECSSIHNAATAIMQLEPWDFMAVYQDAIDHFCHGFMRYHPPKQEWISEKDFELYKDVVTGAYRFHDMMLGVLMELAGEETTIILISDHGFHPDGLRPRSIPNEPAGPASEHRPFGIFAMKGPGIKKDELVYGAGLLDIVPTILSLFGMPTGKDMDGKPLVTTFESPATPKFIDSWDNIRGDSGMHPPDRQADPVDASEAIKQLVDLGYIEEPGEDMAKATEGTIKELRYNLARDYMDAGHYSDSIPILEELWEKHQDESRFGVKLFDSYIDLGQTGGARMTLGKIREKKKKYAVDSAGELKKLSEELKNKKPEELTEQEKRRLNKLRKKAGINMSTMVYLEGRLLLAEKNFAKALESFRKAEKVQTHNKPSLYQNMAETSIGLKDWDEAEAFFNKALEIDPVNPSARLGLSRCRIAQRRNRDALDEAMAAIGMIYHNPKAHYYCGIALHRLGRIIEAVNSLEAAVVMNPVFPDAHKRLALIYGKRLNNPVKAAEHRRLSGESRKRIRDFKSGNALPESRHLVGETFTSGVATLGNIENSTTGGPLPENAVVIVSGLPRSGTSMMMQMLAVGGLPLLTDEMRAADESNPRGYFEYDNAKNIGSYGLWLKEAEGKGVKIVAQLLPRLPMGKTCRVIFMERELQEVVASQFAMLEKLGKKGSRLSKARLAQTFIHQIEKVRRIVAFHSEDVSVLSIDYHDTLNNPAKTALKVNKFLGGDLDETAMAEAVAPEMRNQYMQK